VVTIHAKKVVVRKPRARRKAKPRKAAPKRPGDAPVASIQLIVGLGNPGPEYDRTRHNAGFWFVDALARQRGDSLRHENRFHGETARIERDGLDCRLLKPLTYMNRSGQAVSALARLPYSPRIHPGGA
jgi:hypothetical protein